jgi:hypothetical protein
MKTLLKSTLIAAVLATAGVAAFSHSPGEGGPGYMMGGAGPGHMMGSGPMGAGGPGSKGNFDPARMQARMDQHFEALKTQLKLTTAQDGAWTAFKTAMQPSQAMLARHAQHDELAKLPTLERLEKMKALRTQHFTDMTTAMDQRLDATKTFYAALTPEQQKVFDANAMPGMGRGGHMGGGWGHHGPAQSKL